MKKILIIVASILVLVFVVPYVVDRFATTDLGESALVLGTTTNVADSGLLAQIHPDFTKESKINVKVIARNVESVFQLARDGNVDAVLINSEEYGKKLISEGFGIDKKKVMYSNRNPYHVLAVNPEEHPQVNYENAKKYIEWITSAKTQKMIGEYKKGDKILFQTASR